MRHLVLFPIFALFLVATAAPIRIQTTENALLSLFLTSKVRLRAFNAAVELDKAMTCRDGKIRSHKYQLLLDAETLKRFWASSKDCFELLSNEEAEYGTPKKPGKSKDVVKKGSTEKKGAEHTVELKEVYREYYAKKFMEEHLERENTRKEPAPIRDQQELNTQKFLANR
ncbi:hypothetical protein EAF04_003505 [Stromatinia cepivora]|nr:hypothetical protein EAF04_003505 [Stromatinia cepivora]